MTTMDFPIEDNELFSTIISNDYNSNMIKDILIISKEIDEIMLDKSRIINSLFFGLVFYDNNGDDDTIGYVIADQNSINISLNSSYNTIENKECILKSIKKSFKDSCNEKCYIMPKKN